jgi:hypothetical protein
MKLSLCLIIALYSAGCCNTVVPPSSPADPVTIYLLDHGRHPSLILPAGPGRFVRYAYGDWQWYALSRTSSDVGFAALFWPTQGALGRKELSTPSPIPDCLARNPVENLYEIQVSRTAADRLRARLDALYNSQKPTEHYNPYADLFFVYDPEPYTAFHNCNHVMVAWLKELGCSVYGTGMLSIWQIRH